MRKRNTFPKDLLRAAPIRASPNRDDLEKPHKCYAVQEGDATMLDRGLEPGPKKQLWQSLNFGKVIREVTPEGPFFPHLSR